MSIPAQSAPPHTSTHPALALIVIAAAQLMVVLDSRTTL
jgi:hypothetical protein